MTKKSELIFKKTPRFGTLYYHNAYHIYMEPLIFSAYNEYEQLFFCYSLGMDDNNNFDRWIITPISEMLLNSIEQKNRPIIDAIVQKSKDTIYVIEENINTNQIEEKEIKFSKCPYLMPKNNIFIYENINLDGTRKHSHKIRLSNQTGTKILSEKLSQVSELFVSFCKNYLRSFQIPLSMYSEDAVQGSFIFRVKVNDAELVNEKGGFVKLSEVSDETKFFEYLDNRDIDQRKLKELLDTVIENKLTIEFIDEGTTNAVFTITSEYANKIIGNVNDKLFSYLDSTMVPQADRLDSILEYLRILDQNGFVDEISFGKDIRQVSYYRDACRLLSLVHSYGALTPVGLKVIASDNFDDFLKLIERQFENTECCSIWMAQQSVSSVRDLDEHTAEKFLIDNCKNLSENTSKRRAKTLKSWVRSFKTLN